MCWESYMHDVKQSLRKGFSDKVFTTLKCISCFTIIGKIFIFSLFMKKVFLILCFCSMMTSVCLWCVGYMYDVRDDWVYAGYFSCSSSIRNLPLLTWADADSFFSKPWNLYWKDKNHVYYEWKTVAFAHPGTFSTVDYSWKSGIIYHIDGFDRMFWLNGQKCVAISI